MDEYTAARLSSGNKLFPPTVATESEGMRIKFPKLFGGKETFVSYDDISSIMYDAPMIGFTQLYINIRGKVTTVEGFYKEDCQAIINTWKRAKKGDKKQEWKQNGKLEEEESGNKTHKTTGNAPQELSASQQMKLEVQKLKIDAKVRAEERKIRAKEIEEERKEKEKEIEEEKKREKDVLHLVHSLPLSYSV